MERNGIRMLANSKNVIGKLICNCSECVDSKIDNDSIFRYVNFRKTPLYGIRKPKK